MKISYSALSDIGMKRKMNQDAIFAFAGKEFGLFVVADGMGGLSEGERASKEIVYSCEEWIKQIGNDVLTMEPGSILKELRTVLAEANDRIKEGTREGQLCGSTVVVLFIREDFYGVLSAGDSRLYEIEKRLFCSKIKQITIDDVWRYEGKNTEKLTNAVGINTPFKCRALSDALKKVNTFILCTDGIYKYCQEKDMVEIVLKYVPDKLENAVHEIKETVYQ